MAEVFGTFDGAPVHRVAIAGGGLTAHVLTWGAVLQDLRLHGHDAPLVLGFDAFDAYPVHSPYFGATAGRCANRIRDGRFTLGGTKFQADRNAAGGHCLHGGSRGIGKRLWTLSDVRDDAVELTINVEDGEMGFPGAMEIRAAISLPGDGTLDIRYEATTDAQTLCNIAHHSYFALDDTGDIRDHRLTVAADSYLPTDDTFCPTGEVRPVAGTPWDFRNGQTISDAGEGGPIDANFCLSDDRAPIRQVARVDSAASGVGMDIRTTEPGLQVYDAARIDVPVPGLGGRRMGNYAGLALEPQVWPDAINHPDWPQPVLRPGDTYRQHTQFVFDKAAR